jgi:hypothetical protein
VRALEVQLTPEDLAALEAVLTQHQVGETGCPAARTHLLALCARAAFSADPTSALSLMVNAAMHGIPGTCTKGEGVPSLACTTHFAHRLHDGPAKDAPAAMSMQVAGERYANMAATSYHYYKSVAA